MAGLAADRARIGIAHRRDIDGLRAVAVIPVVLFHVGVPGFAGGFVGVDVFFVISGFLITTIIYNEIQAGKFSLVRFYERRARRILPALFVVTAASLIVSTLLFLPAALAAFGKSVVMAMLFVSNVGFWKDSGYFAPAAVTKPLLHTWSLAVEEQFYVLFPLFLFALRKLDRIRLVFVVAAVALGSFLLSLWALRGHPYLDFFSGPTRAWELALGSILALGQWSAPESRIARTGIRAAGLLLIGYAITAFSGATPFPGANALYPCLGAALIIYAGMGRPKETAGILELRPLVFIGLISYSLYLWSWPIQVYVNYAAPRGLTAMDMTAAIVLSVAVAAGSWRFVERPFRGRNALFDTRTIFGFSAAGAGVIAAAGAILFMSHGLPQRMSPATARQVNAFLEAENVPDPFLNDCSEHVSDAEMQNGAICSFGDRGATRDFILWGDSHAAALVPGMDFVAKRHGRGGIWNYKPGCPPLLGIHFSNPPNCEEHNLVILKRALEPQIHDVFLDAVWAEYAEGTAYISGERQLVLNDSGSSNGPYSRPSQNEPVFDRGMEQIVRTLTSAGKRVVLIASVPELKWNAPEALAKNALWRRPLDVRVDTAAFLQRQAHVNSELRYLEKTYGVTVVYPRQVMCGEIKCEVMVDGQLLYRDMHHLSAFGANYVADRLAGGLFSQP